MPAMTQANRPRILVADRMSESAIARLREAGEVVLLEHADEETLAAEAAQSDALVLRTYTQVTARVIQAAAAGGRLKVIGRGGVGVDNIDVRAAAGAGIVVVNTPAASTHAVADLVVGLIIALQRSIPTCDRRIREGEFASLRGGASAPCELQYQTLGVIGMGRIGRAVGTRLHLGFGTRVIYHDIREIGLLPFAAEPRGRAEDVYAEADVVTLHVPLTQLTRGMINARSLAGFKPGAWLVNTSRGAVVEAEALAEALRSGALAGAAVDVYDPEPPPPDHPLFSAPNVILTPHIASRSRQALAAMNDVVEDVLAVLAGREPAWPVDPETV